MWQTIWPDRRTVAQCSMQTLITWNIFLPFPITIEERIANSLMRRRLLRSTLFNSAVDSKNGTITKHNLYGLHCSNKFPINLIEPINTVPTKKLIDEMLEMYDYYNDLTGGFIWKMFSIISNEYGLEHFIAVFFPYSRNLALDEIVKRKKLL